MEDLYKEKLLFVLFCRYCNGIKVKVKVMVKVKVKVRVKVNFSLEQATKTQRGSRGIALLFL